MPRDDSIPTHSSLQGVLLLNLGTPDSTRTGAVRRYLREFLSDPRVLDMNALGRWLLLRAAILPFRPRRSAAAYRQIWLPEGSPLLVHGQALRDAVALELGDGYAVELAMRYGRPAIEPALDRLEAAGADRVVALPLFPQYATATTASTLSALYEKLARRWDPPPLGSIESFYDAPGFIDAQRASAAPELARFGPDHVLMSYHGLPERQIRRADASGHHCLADSACCDRIGPKNRRCYRAQCLATSHSLATALDLPEDGWSVSFQSRLGRTPWIRPYTDEVVRTLVERGVKRLAVLCPSFVADCLETLEEIGIRLRDQWLARGGEDFLLVRCPNAHARWVRAVAELIRAHAPQEPRTED